MIGMTLTHTQSGITGKIDSTAVDPAGLPMARINDRWFMVADLD